MATTNQIGTQLFISLTRPAEGLREHTALSNRSGVDGVAVWKTGKRGDPFAIVSVADEPNITAAYNRYRTYETLVGGGPFIIIWANVTEVSFKVVPISVRLIECTKMLIGVGGLAGGNSLVRAEWTLQPIEN